MVVVLTAAALLLAAGVYNSSFYWKAINNKWLDKGEIPLSIVRNAGSFIDSLSRKAVEDIVDVTLKNTGYIKWMKYKDSLDVIVEKIDILPDGGRELVVAVSLPPQEGLVAVYSRKGSIMTYISRIAALLPVKEISGLKADFADRELLMVDQHQDEMLGAFFNADYRDIFLVDKKRTDRVLGLVTNYNAYWNQAWEGTGKEACWLWLRQRLQFETAEGGNTIRLIEDQALLKSGDAGSHVIPAEKSFNARYKRVVSEEYNWSPQWERYILGELTDQHTGEKVALLEDYSRHISNLINSKQSHMIKIMNRKGEIKIITAESLQKEN